MSIDAFDSMLKDRELDMAIAEAEAEYTSDNRLIDTREALSGLKRKRRSRRR
jgi:hypothetical protein